MFLDLQYFSVGILHCFPVNLTVIFYSVLEKEGNGNQLFHRKLHKITILKIFESSPPQYMCISFLKKINKHTRTREKINKITLHQNITTC